MFNMYMKSITSRTLLLLLLLHLFHGHMNGFLIKDVPNYHKAAQRRNLNANKPQNEVTKSRELLKRIANTRVSFKECKLGPGQREDCGVFGMDEEDCYKRGCCWGESSTEGVPWCYHSKTTTLPECAQDITDRIECGFYNIRKDQCLASRCCWKPSNANNVPWCYHTHRIPAFEGECGLPPISPSVLSVDGRVVGGDEAKPHSWPWQVSLQAGDHFCGGSLINEQWIVTAAHCEPAFEWGTGNKTIVLGLHNKSETATRQHTASVDLMIPHRDWNHTAIDTDIMLIRLGEKIVFTDTIQPVCLPEQGQRVDIGTHCYTSGWGNTEFMGSSPDVLLQVMLPVVSHETCSSEDWYDNSTLGIPITDNMLCAGYHEGGRGSCQGDSGGPLVCYIDEHWILYGVVSWGEQCAMEARPTLFARVSNFVDWVEKTLAKYP